MPRCARQLDELVLEELRRPELGRRVGQVLALAAAELVVEDAGAAEPAQVGDRLAVVVRRARAAVADHDRRLREPPGRARRRPGTRSRGRPSCIVPSPLVISASWVVGSRRRADGGRRRSGRRRKSASGGRSVAADLGRVPAARMEAAAARRDRSGSAPRPRARSARAAAAVASPVSIVRDRREQRLGVRVDRARVEVVGGRRSRRPRRGTSRRSGRRRGGRRRGRAR